MVHEDKQTIQKQKSPEEYLENDGYWIYRL